MHELGRRLNGIFLIVGTSIGTGILSLPFATAMSGFIPSLLTLGVAFFFMTLASLYVMDTALTLKSDGDFMAMAKQTMGGMGRIMILATYVCLLYSLTAIYTMVGGDWIKTVTHGDLDPRIYFILFISVLTPFLMKGMGGVSFLNDFVTGALVVTFVSMLAVNIPHINMDHLIKGRMTLPILALPLILTAFGSSIVVPLLASYYNHNRRVLKQTIWIANTLTFLAYGAWQWVSFGALGPETLTELASLPDQGSTLINALENLHQGGLIASCGHFFVFFAVLSSILGVGLSLFHFVKDSLKLNDSLLHKSICAGFTFGPAFLILVIYPAGLFFLLSLAGLFVSILLGIIPAIMAVRAKEKGLKFRFNRPLLHLALLFFSLVAGIETYNLFISLKI